MSIENMKNEQLANKVIKEKDTTIAQLKEEVERLKMVDFEMKKATTSRKLTAKDASILRKYQN